MDYDTLFAFQQRAVEIAYKAGKIRRRHPQFPGDTIHWKAGNRLVALGWFHWTGGAYVLTDAGRAAYEAAQPTDGQEGA